jgi:transcriptional regulator with GAF, ATPase, and Fis domain
VIGSFLDLILVSLRLDLAYLRVADPRDGPVIEAARADGQADLTDRTEEIGRALAPALDSYTATTLPNPLASGTLKVAVVGLGIEKRGVVAAASRRADFPTDVETAVLGVAVNHVTTWLGAARVLTEHGRAEAENAYLREEVETALAFGSIVGQSAALRKIISEVDLVARTGATVLLLGESGTGKELFAREIHERSQRSSRPLIKVNCSAIPRDVFESEFFGHVRGAFTGALRDRLGRFELAAKGTIFLDEVGDLPLDLQPKLLRVLQEGEYERVGEGVTHEVDVRVIAATNRDLAAEVRAGRFREDLFYRLSVFPIEIPPLRDRKEDIAPLAVHFVSLAAKRLGVAQPIMHAHQRDALNAHDWPGNARELQNVIERAVILSRGGELRLDLGSPERAVERRPSSSPPSASDEIVRDDEWRRRERANLVAALARSQGRVYGHSGAAELLGVKPSTLQSRLRALGIKTRDKPP